MIRIGAPFCENSTVLAPRVRRCQFYWRDERTRCVGHEHRFPSADAALVQNTEKSRQSLVGCELDKLVVARGLRGVVARQTEAGASTFLSVCRVALLLATKVWRARGVAPRAASVSFAPSAAAAAAAAGRRRRRWPLSRWFRSSEGTDLRGFIFGSGFHRFGH